MEGKMADEPIAAVGAILAGAKINSTQPDEVVLVLKVPGIFKDQALEIAKHVGAYFDAIAFMSPKAPEKQA